MKRILVTATPAVSGPIDNSHGRILYWSFRETSGAAPASFRFWDGSGSGATTSVLRLASISLLAAESTRDTFVGHALPYRGGLYLEVIAGSFEGSIQVCDGTDEDEAMPVVVIGTLDLNVTS